MEITTREARAHFSTYLDNAEQGESITIARRGHAKVALVKEEELEKLKNYQATLKAKLFDLFMTKSPNEINEMHDVLCVLMDADEITNPDVVASIEDAENGNTEAWVMP
ncbi:type II toxin-antitoxin system Phd/YefM family antitoxin [Lentisphaera profundi]|uniref:Antitoxin n=1 Tax=Lentisphaera profundi TaxID=1658616 RepID=A0ABY7W2X1_9BACT|nr:type II toxin-antitoxin system Phd/YefM family antitoxin [Lentisphaera profundi]WDE98623.1 type II toxin-antitoxin system Phd/YefM family antitoxin [Lentisphaera profundi]